MNKQNDNTNTNANESSHSKWGGARRGAGRKATAVKQVAFYATQEVADILAAVEGSKSAYIVRAIIRYHELGGE